MGRVPWLGAGVLALTLVAATAPAPAHPFPDTIADEWTESEACWRQAARAYVDHQSPSSPAGDLVEAGADAENPARTWLHRGAALADREPAPPHDPSEPGLAPALLDLYATQDVDVDLETQARVSAFAADLDPRLRTDLAPLVQALAHAVAHHREAYAGPSTDQGLLIHAADELVAAAGDQAPALRSVPEEAWPDEPVRDPVGLIAVGSHGNDTYTRDRFLQVDPGGADAYENNAGGGGVVVDSAHIFNTQVTAVALHLDLGGDDFYGEEGKPLSEQPVRAQGGAQRGVGVMVDWVGNDTYRGNEKVQGAGFKDGVGVAWDRHGNDSWEASGVAEGGGIFGGLGLLIDEMGDDSYYAGGRGIGYAGGMGAHGLHVDAQGDDVRDDLSHNTLGYGESGGLGVLLDDGEGADSYDEETPSSPWAGNDATWAHNDTGLGCDDG